MTIRHRASPDKIIVNEGFLFRERATVTLLDRFHCFFEISSGHRSEGSDKFKGGIESAVHNSQKQWGEEKKQKVTIRIKQKDSMIHISSAVLTFLMFFKDSEILVYSILCLSQNESALRIRFMTVLVYFPVLRPAVYMLFLYE